MLEDEPLEALSEDIKKNGQRQPIVLYEDKILDGRNRWRACQMADVEPEVKTFRGSKKDALDFVASMEKRRDKTPSQAAIFVARWESANKEAVEKMRKEAASKKGGDKRKAVSQIIDSQQDHTKRTDHKLAETHGTNRTYVANARKVAEKSPELADKVAKGEMTLPQATTELRREEKKAELKQKAERATEAFADQPKFDLLNMDVCEGLKSVRDHRDHVRLIFADPPYNIGIDYGDHHNDSLPRQEFLDWVYDWLDLSQQCLADDGSIWVMINDEYAADFVNILRELGLHMRSWIKWYETFGVNCANNFNRTSRHILYFVREPDSFVFNETEVLRPSDRQTKHNDKRAQSSGKILDDVWQIPRLNGTCKERIPDFPTQLPLELLSRIVRVASEPGDLVVDPFNGSGTTGVAAIQNGRKYIGIDASETFIDLASQRLTGASL